MPRVTEIAPSVGLYPLLTKTVVACPGADGRQATTMQVYTHVPFNPIDLAACKTQAGEFSTNTSRFISVFEGCLSSHKPDWDDCNVLLRTLLSEVERDQVTAKARGASAFKRKKGIYLSSSSPSNRKWFRAFLGMAGFCRIWIPEFGLWAKPLYDCVKGADHDPFYWTPEADRAFKILKRKLMEAPALGLPDLSKPFQLYVHERRGVALGVLTQLLGAWKRPVAYFSKQLDQVAKGWPACLRAVAATALLLEEAEKLTLGGVMQIYTPHMVRALLDAKGGLWLTQARIARYQAKLLENSEVTLQPCPSLNPATLLPETEEQKHDCLEIIDVQYSSRPDLKDVPLPNADYEWYTDGSSTVIDGQRRAGYAVVTLHDTVEAEGLPAGTSAQLAELIALTRVLELSKGKRVNIFTDSKYAFGVLHAHAGL
ncbi:unnamed protein product [Lepidochelys kempii]